MVVANCISRHSRLPRSLAQPLSQRARPPRPPASIFRSVSHLGDSRCYSNLHDDDPRLKELGRQIEDDFAHIRANYATPKHAIVLAHGLLGFAELRVAGSWLPAVHYWRGISEALTANGIQVITASVPPSGSIEQRAAKLGEHIAQVAGGKSVNIIAHSMGGLDARYMISHIRPKNVNVISLVTVASPNHGSAFADFVFDEIGPKRLPAVYKLVQGFGLETGAFSQLTKKYMTEEFNPRTPDDPNVRYFSYGAMMNRPPLLSPFRRSHKILQALEGPNDGLVSVQSSKWGDYKGTLVGVSHLDLINWTNRLRWTFRRLVGRDPTFNAIAFYLDIADMLAKEGL